MKKLLSLLLTVCLLSIPFPAVVNAASYIITGDSVIYKPPGETKSYVKYTLTDGGRAVTEGVSWDVEGVGVSIDENGYLIVTSEAEGDITITAQTEEGQAKKTVTVSSYFLFYDYEDMSETELWTANAETGHKGGTATKIKTDDDGNKYVTGGKINSSDASSDVNTVRPILAGANSGLTEMYSSKPNTITIEGKFRNMEKVDGVGERRWIFFIYFNNAAGTGLLSVGGNLGSADRAPYMRVIDIRANQANGTYTLVNDHNVEGKPGTWTVGQTTTATEVGTYGEWLNVRMTFDYENKSYTVWAGDRVIYENYPLPLIGSDAAPVRQWFFGCDGDDIAIYSGRKEPLVYEELPSSEASPGWEEAFSGTYDEAGPAFSEQLELVIGTDEANSTRLLAEKLDGKYAVDVLFETDKPNPYAEFHFGEGLGSNEAVTNPFARFKIYSQGAMILEGTGTNYTGVHGFRQGEENLLRLLVDSDSKSFDAYLNNFDEPALKGAKFYSGGTGLFGVLRMAAADGNVKVNKVNVYRMESGIPDSALSVYNSLPVSLAADPKNVTANIDVSALSGYTITSSDESVIETDGTIHWLPFDESEATLYVEFTVDGSTFKKAYDLVISPSLEGYDALELCYEKFHYLESIPAVAEDNLQLITESVLGITAEWKSSDTSIIGHDGSITKGKSFGFADLTLTLSYGDESKSYGPVTVAVVPDGSTDAAVSGYETSMGSGGAPLSNAFDKQYDTYFKGTPRANHESSITLTFDGSTYVSRLFIAENQPSIVKYKIEYSDDGEEWTEAASGAITDMPSRLVAFETVKAKYLKLTMPELLESFVELTELAPLCILTEKQAAEAAISNLAINTAKKVSGNMTLPSESAYGNVILWKSSPAGIISSTGVYTAPEYDTEVTLTAYIETSSGTVERMFVVTVAGKNGPKGAIVTNNGGGNRNGNAGGGLAAALPGNTNTPAFAPDTPKASFTDMQGHWAQDYVKELADKGIVFDAELFNPERPITREEFTKLLVCAAGVEILPGLPNSFKDAEGGAWYVDYILSAQKSGIISGISEDTFGIGRQITRQDAALMLVRALGSVPETVIGEPFADDDDIAAYSAGAVYEAKERGLISGYGDNTFKPLNELTRAEAAAIICRFCAARN